MCGFEAKRPVDGVGHRILVRSQRWMDLPFSLSLRRLLPSVLIFIFKLSGTSIVAIVKKST
jgi:hypothetical protein